MRAKMARPELFEVVAQTAEPSGTMVAEPMPHIGPFRRALRLNGTDATETLTGEPRGVAAPLGIQPTTEPRRSWNAGGVDFDSFFEGVRVRRIFQADAFKFRKRSVLF